MSHQYIAIANIEISPGVFAYVKGSEVSEEAVKRNGWEALVARPTAKVAQAAVAETAG